VLVVAALHDELPLIVTHAQPAEEQSAYCVSSEQAHSLVAVNAAFLPAKAVARRTKMIT
jgi:hypothetical protein